jgi:hypothetical protein
MTAIQEISAGLEGSPGLASLLIFGKTYPKPVLYCVLNVVSVANVFNLGADIFWPHSDLSCRVICGAGVLLRQ